MGDQFDDKEELTEAAGENEQENDKDEYENFCFLCRRPESQCKGMIELPNNIHICTDCMQKSFDSMNTQINNGNFNYADLMNMPNVSMIDLSNLQPPTAKRCV